MRTCSLYCSCFLRDPFHVRPCTESLNLSPKMMLKSNSAWDLCAKTSHELNEWPFSLRTCSLSYYRFLLRNPFRPGAAQKTPTSMSKDDVLFNYKCIISRIIQSYQVLYYDYLIIRCIIPCTIQCIIKHTIQCIIARDREQKMHLNEKVFLYFPLQTIHIYIYIYVYIYIYTYLKISSVISVWFNCQN